MLSIPPFTKTRMHCVSLCLLLISASASIPTYNGEEVVTKVSGEDYGGIDILSRFSLFLGLHSPSYHPIPSLSPSPSPTPTEGYVTRIPPLHHKSHYTSAFHSQREVKARRRPRIIIDIVLIVVSVVVLVLGVLVLVVCKWWRRRRSRRSSGQSKVSYDPGPETFYLDSLATVLEVESNHCKQSEESKNAPSNESLHVPCDERRVKFSSASSIRSMKSESVLMTECEPDDDDDESFQSVFYCHSSDELFSVVSDTNHSCASGRCSPLSSCTSAEFKPIQFPPIKPPLRPTSFESKHPSPLPKFEGGTEKIPISSPSSPRNSEPKEERSLIRTPSPRPSKPIASNATASEPEAKLPPMPPPPPLPPCGPHTIRPPPPPPPPFLSSAAVGKDGTTLPKLKPLHWDKVRAAPDRSMVWDKIRSSSFELDEQMIESLFGYSIHSNTKSEDTKNKSSSPSKHVLDHKRLQNITILMKAVNATAEQVCEALKQGRGLSVQQLEALAKMAPTKEEEEKLANFSDDVGELGSAEIFVKEVLDIQFAFSRIQVMLFRETFIDEVVHLKKSFAMLEEACAELRSSRLFFRLLEAVLKTGNRMNVGTIRGGARAFKLDTLLKLADVKGTDGKTTLLHFVVQEMIRSEGFDIVSGLSTELCNVKRTASVDLDVLASSVMNLSEGMKQLKRLVEVELPIDEKSGSFANSMRLFSNCAETTIKKLKDDEDGVLVHVREVTEYYHGDVGKDEANPLRIFVIVRDFLGMLDRVCKEIGSSKTYQCTNLGANFR